MFQVAAVNFSEREGGFAGSCPKMVRQGGQPKEQEQGTEHNQKAGKGLVVPDGLLLG